MKKTEIEQHKDKIEAIEIQRAYFQSKIIECSRNLIEEMALLKEAQHKEKEVEQGETDE